MTDLACHSLSDNYFLPDKQCGFIPGTTSDLIMLMFLTRDWQDVLDDGLDTVLGTQDIAGAFDRVWQGELLEKLRAKGIQGDLFTSREFAFK